MFPKFAGESFSFLFHVVHSYDLTTINDYKFPLNDSFYLFVNNLLGFVLCISTFSSGLWLVYHSQRLCSHYFFFWQGNL